MRSCDARPSSPSRAGVTALTVSSSGAVARSPPVVIVTAGIPSETNGPCSWSVNGNARLTSCEMPRGTSGGCPASCSIDAAAVARSVGAGERGESPLKRRTGGSEPAIASRLTTATGNAAPPTKRLRISGCSANHLAPAPP